MRRIIYLCCMALLFLPIHMMGQEYVPLTVSSGFNEDVIAEDSPAATFTSTAVDDTGNGANNVFMSIDYPGATVGLPANGLINSIATTTPGLSFQLAPYDDDNVLRINENGGEGTLVFANPQSALQIFVLATSGSDSSNFTGVITFTDNSTQAISSQTIPDWYQTGTNPAAIQGIGRVSRGGGSPDNNSSNPKLFQVPIAIEIANQTKLIESISFTKTSSDSGFLNIFGVSAEYVPDCPKPVELDVTELGSESATLSWEQVGGVPDEGFEWELLDADEAVIDFDIVLPTSDFEAVLTGLDAMTEYTFRVKALCDVFDESAWASIEFTTSCQPESILPYVESFDTYGTGSGIFPPCWERPEVYGTTPFPSIVSQTNAPSSPGVLRFQSAIGTPTYAVSPAFAEDINNLRVTFKLRKEGNSSGTMDVGVMSDAGDVDTFELIETIDPGADYTYNEYVIYLDDVSLSGANNHIAFRYNASAAWYYFIDDFVVEEIPSCIEPDDLDANNITSTSAELSWISDGDLFDVEIVEAGEDPTGTPTDTGVGNPFTTVTPLDPATDYEYYVRQDCGFGDLSEWRGPFAFTTECTVFEDPFTENFDTTPTGTSTNPTVPNCWSFIDTGAGYGYVSSTTPNTSPNNFYIYNSSDTSGDYILVSPETDNLGNGTMRVKFSARSTTASQTLQVGTLSDAADPSTFTIVETIVLTTTHTDYSVVLPVTTDDFFGFRHGMDATYRTVYIDTISYEEIPSCMEVSDLDANGVTSTGAELSWISDGNLFDIEIVEAGEDPTGVPTDVGVGNPFVTVDPLTPTTSYDYYVRQDCGAGDLSTWTGPYTFTTLCAVEMAPTMVEDFTSYTGSITSSSLPCWAEATANNIGDPLTGTTSTWTSGVYNNITGHINGNAAYINLYGTDNEWLISPVIDLGDGTTEYALRYDTSVVPWSGSANVEDMGSDKYVAVIISTDGGATWSETNVLTMYDNNNIPNNGGLSEILSLDGYTGEVRFAFYAKSTTTTPDLRFYIDNFRVEEMPACLEPLTGSVDNIGTDSATINWATSDSPNVSGYEYEIRTGEDDDETVVVTGTTVAPTTTADVTGLSGATDYKVYVRSECAVGEYSQYNLVATFTTECDATDVPYLVPINDTTGTDLPLCVSVEDVNGDNNTWRTTTGGNGIDGRVMYYTYNSNVANDWFFLRGINMVEGESYRLTFKQRVYSASYPEKLRVSYGNAPNAAAMNEEIYDETLSNTTGEEVLIDFIAEETGVVYIGFQVHSVASQWNLYVGEIYVQKTPTCFPAQNITLDDVGKFSADISWDAPDLGNDVDDGYEVEIRTEGEPGDAVGYVDTVNVTGLVAELTGLDPDTSYYVYIKTLCTEVDDESLWSEPFQFRTLCDAPELVNEPGGEVCGSGSVELEAIYTSGIVEWYDSEEGGELLHTGETFTTPNITEETSFWVQAKADDAINGNGGLLAPVGTSATSAFTYGLVFDADVPFTLNTVDVYLAGSSAGTIVLRLTDSSGATIEEQSIAVPAGSSTSPVLHTLQLDMEIPEGEGMRLLAISGPSMVRDSAIGGFPYDLPGVGEITSGYISGTSTAYYYFYNWTFEKGCTSERTEVVVEITDAPEFSLSTNAVAVCGTTPSEVVTVVEGLADYEVFEWSPSTGVTGDETTGWVFNPTTSTTYTLIASKLTEDCAQTVTVDVNVGNYPTPAPLDDEYSVCINEIQMLNVQVPVSGSNAHTITWSPATNLYIDLAATVPYTGQNVNRVYFKSPTGVEDAEYTVTVTNNNGCTVEDTTLINVPIIDAPDLDVVYLCEVSSVSDVNELYEVDAVWYEVVDSQTPLTEIAMSGTYYVATNADGCQSERVEVDVTVVGVSTPTTTESEQQFCDSATIEDIVVNHTTGANLNVYETATGGTALDTGTALYTGTFYIAEQIGDCESDRLAVQITVTQTPPAVGQQTVTICGFEVLANVEIGQQPDAELVWYANETTSQPMNANSQIYAGTYYASQRIGICESARTAITFIVNETLPQPTASSQTFCGSAVVSDLVVTGAEGAMFRWFDSATSTTPLAGDAALSNGTYYVSQELNGCESNRKAISVQIVNTVAPQIANMSLCEGTTIGEVEIPATTGVTYKWYVSPTATTALPESTTLTNGVYYISSVYSGCESERVVVDIETAPVPDAPTGEAEQAFVYNISIDEITIADLVVNEEGVLWFAHADDAATLTNPLQSDMPLANNTTYYAVLVSDNGCVSEPFAVTVTVTLGNAKFDRAKLVYYPNPTQGMLTIQYTDTIESVEIYNTVGQLVGTQEFNNNQITVDMSGLSNGTYLLKLHIDGYQQLIKVVKN